MPATLWKYELLKVASYPDKWTIAVPKDYQVSLDLPQGSTPLHVVFEGHALFLYVYIPDKMATPAPVRFWVIGTGQDQVLDAQKYVGTASILGHVLHVFGM